MRIFTALGAHGVGRASGDCVTQGAGEAAYWPGEDSAGSGSPGRQGCFEDGTDHGRARDDAADGPRGGSR